MNYNTLRNKPTINYRELIGDNTVSEVGGITEEQFNTLLNTDLSSYYTKAQIDELFARSYVFRDKSGSIVTFDCPSSTPAFYQIGSEIVAVQSGSGDPSPTNIRPISGWGAVNVNRTGINIWDEEWEVGGISTSSGQDISLNGIRSKGYSPCKPSTAYHAKFTDDGYVFWYDADKNYISNSYSEASDRVVQSPNNAYWFRVRKDGITTYNNDISINYPSTDTDYHAYNGQTYTTQLKDGQGNPMTCYGGGLINAGGSQALLVTKGHIASYNGETLPSTWLSDRDVYAAGTTPSIGAEVVYELETPLQIPQDSLSIMSTGGINNIWCDTGDIRVRALDKIIQG